jgi:hypothetical protein
VSDTPGSVTLTPEQADWYQQRFGVRYTGVQANHLLPPRRVRRHQSKHISELDIEVLQAQDGLRKRLEHTNIVKASKE